MTTLKQYFNDLVRPKILISIYMGKAKDFKYENFIVAVAGTTKNSYLLKKQIANMNYIKN